MPKIIYIENSGRSHEVDLAIGRSLMEGARDQGVAGIPADCGGACACSTCHMHVDPAWAGRLPQIEEMERDMLDFAENVKEEVSRLICQIRATAEMEGLVLYVPA